MKLNLTLTLATLLVSTSAFAEGKPNDWHLDVKKDLLTNQVEAVATKNEVASQPWQEPESIVMRCANGQFELYVTTNDILDSDQTQTRIYFDEEEPMEAHTGRADSLVAMFFRGQLSTLVGKMRTRSKMVVEVTPWRGQPRAVAFDLDGMTKHLDVLAEYCPAAGVL